MNYYLCLLLPLLTLIVSNPLILRYNLIEESNNVLFNIGRASNEKSIELNMKSSKMYPKKPKANLKGIKSEFLHDTLFLEEQVTINDFFFHLRYKTTEIYDTLYLLYKTNPDLSSLHQLLSEKRINHLSFGIIGLQNKVGYVSLGGVPEEVLEKNKYSATCKVTGGNNWGCGLKNVIFDDKLFKNHYDLSFQANDARILAPKMFMNFLMEEYFKDLIRRNVCEKDTLICKCSSFSSFPNLIFNIDNNLIKLNQKSLYRRTALGCQLYIQENVEEPDKWQFGMSFLNNFVTLFNYENSTITFYSNEAFKQLDSKPHTTLKKYYIFIIMLLCILMLFFIIKIKTNFNTKEDISKRESRIYLI